MRPVRHIHIDFSPSSHANLTSACMATLTSQLESHGYTIHARQLPAVGNSKPPSDLSEDIAAVRALIEEAIGNGNDVVVFPHSWGGLVTQSALNGLSKKEREAAGKAGGVVRTGYLAAFIVPEGVSLIDSIPGIPGWWDIKDPYVHAIDPDIFYNDLPAEEQKKWFDQLQSQSLGTFYAKTTGACWKAVPTSYLLCEQDKAIPAAAQEAMVNGVKEAGGDIETTRIDAGHSPFLSRVEETVAWMRKVAGEKV